MYLDITTSTNMVYFRRLDDPVEEALMVEVADLPSTTSRLTIRSGVDISGKAVVRRVADLRIWLAWINVFLPLLVGGMVYLAWRTQSLLMFSWADFIGLEHLISALRQFAAPVLPYVPEWILFSLPDAAWVYSITAAYVIVWKTASCPEGLFWISLGCLLGVGGELGQLAGVVPGTFDPVDLIVMLGAAYLSFITTRRLL